MAFTWAKPQVSSEERTLSLALEKISTSRSMLSGFYNASLARLMPRLSPRGGVQCFEAEFISSTFEKELPSSSRQPVETWWRCRCFIEITCSIKSLHRLSRSYSCSSDPFVNVSIWTIYLLFFFSFLYLFLPFTLYVYLHLGTCADHYSSRSSLKH